MSKKPSTHGLFLEAEQTVEEELEELWRRTYRSNNELVTALEQLRRNYCAVLAGEKRIERNEEILAQVDAALTRAAEAKNLV
jgi:hypothetical protein